MNLDEAARVLAHAGCHERNDKPCREKPAKPQIQTYDIYIYLTKSKGSSKNPSAIAGMRLLLLCPVIVQLAAAERSREGQAPTFRASSEILRPNQRRYRPIAAVCGNLRWRHWDLQGKRSTRVLPRRHHLLGQVVRRKVSGNHRYHFHHSQLSLRSFTLRRVVFGRFRALVHL